MTATARLIGSSVAALLIGNIPPGVAQQQTAFPAPLPTAAYQKVGLVDFKTDKTTMMGKRVQLTGSLQPFTDGVALLTMGPGDIHPVFIGYEAVQRDQRRKLNACPAACSAIVAGTVAMLRGQAGLQAETITMTDPSQLRE